MHSLIRTRILSLQLNVDTLLPYRSLPPSCWNIFFFGSSESYFAMSVFCGCLPKSALYWGVAYSLASSSPFSLICPAQIHLPEVHSQLIIGLLRVFIWRFIAWNIKSKLISCSSVSCHPIHPIRKCILSCSLASGEKELHLNSLLQPDGVHHSPASKPLQTISLPVPTPVQISRTP